MGFEMTRKTRRQVRLGIESLEKREVPATFKVMGVAELVSAVAAVANTSGPNTILLAPGTYRVGGLQAVNAKDLTIEGNTSKGTVSIVGDRTNRVFEVDGGSVTFSGLNISGGGGVSQGGGINAVNADVTLKSTSVTGNTATTAGGGIAAIGGALNIVSSSIKGNSVAGGSTELFGGGIADQNGTLNISKSAIEDNIIASGSNAMFGGGIAALNTPVSLSHTTLSGNGALFIGQSPRGAATGGAIFEQGSTLRITNSVLAQNQINVAIRGTAAASSGGAATTVGTNVTVNGGSVTGNTLNAVSAQGESNLGSAFSTLGGSLNITGTTFNGNTPKSLKNVFDHPGATVVLQNLTFNGKKVGKTLS